MELTDIFDSKVSDMLRRGVNVALGTDGGPSNNTYDLLREMKHAALLQPIRTGDPRAIRVEEVIEMATINGAKALHLHDKIVDRRRGEYVL